MTRFVGTCCAVAALLGSTTAWGNGLTVKVDSSHPVPIVLPDQVHAATLLIRNNTGRRIRGTFRFGIRERSNEQARFPEEQTIDAADGSEIRLNLSTDLIANLGIKYLDWQWHGERKQWSGRTSFAHMDPVGTTRQIQPVPPPEDDFIFGIAGGIRLHHERYFKERFLRAAAIIGAEAYRSDMSWNVLQPSPDTWKWKGLDEMVALARQFGMFIQPLVAYGNPWAVSEGTKALAKQRDDLNHIWRYPPRREPWAEFAGKLAERYGTRMQYYEIWNEPDISFFKGNAEQYLGLLRSAYEAIKEANPEIRVTTGGFTSMSHGELDRELQKRALTEGRDSFDGIAWHRHGDFAGFQDEVDDKLLPWLKELGHEETPLVFNESATARPFAREWELARQLVKKMTFTWARGAIGHYWYNLMRSAPKFQMLNKDWTPRPSYPAYNQLARLLRGRRFSHELELGDGRWGFAFRGDGVFTGNGDDDWVLVAWTQKEGADDNARSVQISPEAEARHVDLMGNTQTAPIDDSHTVRLPVTPKPSYLVITDSSVHPTPSNSVPN